MRGAPLLNHQLVRLRVPPTPIRVLPLFTTQQWLFHWSLFGREALCHFMGQPFGLRRLEVPRPRRLRTVTMQVNDRSPVPSSAVKASLFLLLARARAVLQGTLYRLSRASVNSRFIPPV